MARKKEDSPEKQKRRHRWHIIRNILIIIILLVIAGLLYLYRDAWLPRLTGSVDNYNTITQNDGELAEGNFPLTIAGNSGYQINFVGESLFILHDAYLDVYSLHGDEEDSRQHAYHNAALSTSDKYALVYEKNGTSFRLDRKGKNVYSKTIDENIISGIVSDSGTVALITESSSYASAISIYDDSGKRIYQRNCTDHVVDICFHDDDAGCFFTTIDANNGIIQSTLTSVLFRQVDTQWTSLPLDTMVVETELTSSNTLCVIGDSSCTYYSKTGEVLGTYTYSGTLISESIENGRIALLVQDDQKREMTLILLDQSAQDVKTIALDATAQAVLVSDGDAYVMNENNITSYDFSGTAIATVSLEGTYTSFLKEDGYIFLLGYNQIDRIDFKE